MDSVYFLFSNPLIIYVIILSTNCADSKERVIFTDKVYNHGNPRKHTHWQTQRQHSTKFNSRNRIYNALLPKFKQSGPPNQAYPLQSKLFESLGQEYPLHDATGNMENFECPEGYRKRTSGGVEFCSPLNAEHEIIEAKQPLCPDGQIFVDTRCIDIAQHNIESNKCPYGMVKFISKNQAQCVYETSVKDNPCDAGTSLIETSAGWTCARIHTPVKKPSFTAHKPPFKNKFKELKSSPTWDKNSIGVPRCEDGKVAAMSQDGYICMDPVFPPSVCPTDRVPSMSARGIQCVPCPYGQTVVHMEDGVKCETVDITTTEVPCPQGLQPVHTPVGQVCQYIPTQVSEHVNKCPEGKLKIVEGNRICTNENVCPPGQNMVHIGDGKERCMPLQTTDMSYCSEDEVYNEGACISIHLAEKIRSDTKNLCIPGHFLVVSNSGSVCQLVTDGQEINAQNNLLCGPGSVVIQTGLGFQCLQEKLPLHVVPMCDHGFVIAKLGEMFECISRYDADLICSDDEQMVRVDDGYVCKKVIPERNCGPDTFYHTDKDGRTMCVSQHQATELCGDGYIAVREADSFLCKKLTEDVSCPAGYVLSIDYGEPLCVEEGADCYGTVDYPLSRCLNQVPYCQQGYYLNLDLDVPRCALVINQQIPSSQVDTGLQPCDAEGGLRRCDLPADLLLSGCNPDCANGGTCVNDTCLCPQGITGHACHIDVNECDGRPCEYGCDNMFGSYQCTCPAGMLLGTDGQTCSDPGCIPDCLNNGECLRGQCRCTSGFEGLYCQIDKDECMKYGDRLCQHQCRNTYGSYSCICPPGSRLNPDGRTCLNTTCIPECRNGGSCNNHRCLCPSGFYGIICQFDVNECRTKKPCDQICKNSWGSYVCSCNEGYILHTDGHSCMRVTVTV